MNAKRWSTSGAAFSLILAAVTAGPGAAGAATPAPAPGASPTTAATHESPFACNVLALDQATRKRHFDELGPALRGRRLAVRELPDGYEFEFPSDSKTIQMVQEWAAQERLCCPFFEIQVRMEKENGPVWLRLTGRPGVKDFIRVDGAAWIQK
jgi:predicted protein tyrosine phosphatase